EGVEALEERFVLEQHAQALVGHLEDVGQGLVGERGGAGVGHGPGHVRHAVVDHAVDQVGGVVVGGWPYRLDAATLVDRDVDDDAARLHLPEHWPVHQDRCAPTGYQYGADQEIGLVDRVLDIGG